MKLFQQYYFFNKLLITPFHIILFSHILQDKPFFIQFLLIKYQLRDLLIELFFVLLFLVIIWLS